eukprot:symbB.v1.2.037421.t1/scaffold5521.1/size26208/1
MAAIQREDTQQMVGLVGVAAGSATAMMTAGAVSVLFEAIPEGLALLVAVREWHEPCDQPLQLWLAVVGAVGLLITVPAVLVLCRERKKINNTMGNEDLVAYMVRKQRAQQAQQAFEENSDFEDELKEFRSAPSLSDCLIRFIQCPLLIWECLGAVWYFNSSSDDDICADTIRHWSLGILLLKLLMPCFTCCCVLACGLGAGIAHLPEVVGSDSGTE